MKYYHITNSDKKTIKSILKNGLRCNSEGEIFVFENKSIIFNNVINSVADLIANNQLFLQEYVMFEIDDKGFNTELVNDNVGEISSKQQWYVQQPFVDKKHIIIYGTYKNTFKNTFKNIY
jgi:hypothetical protein